MLKVVTHAFVAERVWVGGWMGKKRLKDLLKQIQLLKYF